jgi:hypothetical protein
MVPWLVTSVVGHLTLTLWWSRFSITTVRNTPLLSNVSVISQGGKHYNPAIPSFLTLRNEMSTKKGCLKGGRLREKKSVGSDELCEIRPTQWACLHIIARSGFGALKLPQNLGMGQKECSLQPQSLGAGPRKMKGRWVKTSTASKEL